MIQVSTHTPAEVIAVPMTASHLDQVLSIERASFAAPWSREMFERELSNRSARPTVFLMHGEIVGFLCWWAVQDEGHLTTVAVHPRLRGEGIGKGIMTHLEKMCLKEGLKRIILEVARRNTVARTLYKRLGYSAIGFRKRYYKETDDDAIVMEKWLRTECDSETQPGGAGAE